MMTTIWVVVKVFRKAELLSMELALADVLSLKIFTPTRWAHAYHSALYTALHQCKCVGPAPFLAGYHAITPAIDRLLKKRNKMDEKTKGQWARTQKPASAHR